ncbi:hypothetical protein WN51_00566 [Melipona quadrifasciata]|uniref:Uncharacterized protein n=1 Tax=Melipona quadrifasciata TaxID=166423 RepID=A0A0N0BGC9_9HYME|nr:hypothetical protein WN51_00566 [Melipona quadrifasciata]
MNSLVLNRLTIQEERNCTATRQPHATSGGDLPGMQSRRTLRKKSVCELRAPTNVGFRVKADSEIVSAGVISPAVKMFLREKLANQVRNCNIPYE